MTHDFMGPNGPESNLPVVFERDGKVYANSRDVAALFEKRHDHVLRDIRNALAETGAWGVPNFGETPYVEPTTGQTYKSYDMTKNGFTYLVQGYTGAKVAGFKIAYIERFDAMESALKNPLAGFAIPRTMADALRLAADQSERLAQQQKQIETMAPKVDGFDRFANSDGLFSLERAAKDLGQPPKTFNKRLQAEGWIFKRPGGGKWIAYQDKIKVGYLEHKTYTGQRADGSDFSSDQVMVTPKGIAKLALMFGAKSGQSQLSLNAAE